MICKEVLKNTSMSNTNEYVFFFFPIKLSTLVFDKKQKQKIDRKEKGNETSKKKEKSKKKTSNLNFPIMHQLGRRKYIFLFG